MKTVATPTAVLVVGPPDVELLFQKTELGVEDTPCSQCRGWGDHWWHPITWALGPVGHAGNFVVILRIPLMSGQSNEEVPAVAGM